MQPDFLASLRRLSEAELVSRVGELVRHERGGMVLVVAHLAELDTRDVHFRAGHGSLFGYCRDVLALSEQEAYNRIAVARAARRHPVILQMLEDGALNLTTARLIAPHLTTDNHAAVLERARGKTKAQVEELAASLWPQPDVPSFVRKLPAPKSATNPAPPLPSSAPVAASASGAPLPPFGAAAGFCSGGGALIRANASPAPPPLHSLQHSSSPDREPSSFSPALSLAGSSASVAQGSGSPVAPDDPAALAAATGRFSTPRAALPPATRSAEVTPLSPDRYKVQVTIGAETLEKLRLAKDLLRHAVPSGDEAIILDRALTALLTDLAHKRLAAADTPRPGSPARPGSRSIPAEVKRRVWLRDRGCCAFVAAAGRRCSERAFLEFHHVEPHALGGEATLANIQLRCRSHNAYEARLWFGHGNGNGGIRSVREPRAAYGLMAGGHAPDPPLIDA